jgi:hypothetical protein
MHDTLDPRHEALVEHLFRRVCIVLGFSAFTLTPLRRRKRGVGKFQSYRLGYTKIGDKNITVDLYTPRTMKPRKIDAILRVFAHELAHHASPPKRVRIFFASSIQSHHPDFWKTYKKFVAILSHDEMLGAHFKK